jgi:hypothetical protein
MNPFISGSLCGKIYSMTKTLLAAIAFCCIGSSALAEFPSGRPFDAIAYQYIVTENPRREIHVAVVDLTSKDISIRVSRGGDDPDGEDQYQTTLMKPSKIANREDFELAVNGDFFSARSVKDAEGSQSGFVGGIWAKVAGPAVTDGKVWALPEKARPTVAIGANNRVKLVDLKDPASDIRQAIAGNVWLVKEGKNIAATEGKFAITTHPRTAAGVSKDGNKLILAVVDGRRKDATGMPLKDLADLMLSQGAFTALNLDGGGSSEMVIRDPETGKLHVVNKPSDARERSVANVLGISVKGARQSEEVVLDRLAPATQKSDAAQ